MANPAGNYPGRQIFIGNLANGVTAFAYLITGRSSGSQGRWADYVKEEKSIRIKPVDEKEKHDQFRHYQAVRISLGKCLLISNNQAVNDMLVEKYSCMPSDERESADALYEVLKVADLEYDNPDQAKRTSRIAGLITLTGGDGDTENCMLGIVADRIRAYAIGFTMPEGQLLYVPTYNGDVEYKNFDPKLLLSKQTVYNTNTTTAEDLAEEIFATSDYIDPKYGDLRALCIAGEFGGKGPGAWKIFIKNRHKPNQLINEV